MHPFGYGRELYFWSFVVAILVFALGAGVSVYEGVLHILSPEPAESPLIAFAVLGIAFALEGWSTLAALKDFNAARRGSIWQEIRDTKDATTLVILLENTGALVGLVLAAIGLGISLVTGNPMWDGLASVLIGLVLACSRPCCFMRRRACSSVRRPIPNWSPRSAAAPPRIGGLRPCTM